MKTNKNLFNLFLSLTWNGAHLFGAVSAVCFLLAFIDVLGILHGTALLDHATQNPAFWVIGAFYAVVTALCLYGIYLILNAFRALEVRGKQITRKNTCIKSLKAHAHQQRLEDQVYRGVGLIR